MKKGLIASSLILLALSMLSGLLFLAGAAGVVTGGGGSTHDIQYLWNGAKVLLGLGFLSGIAALLVESEKDSAARQVIALALLSALQVGQSPHASAHQLGVSSDPRLDLLMH